MIRLQFQVYPNDNIKNLHVIRQIYIDRIKKLDDNDYYVYGVWLDINPDFKDDKNKRKRKQRLKPHTKIKHYMSNGDLILMHKVFLKIRRLIGVEKI